MNHLSTAQAYLLCAMDQKGRINLKEHQGICMIAACLLELLQYEIVEIKDKKLYVTKEIGEQHAYLSPLYNFIKNTKPMKLEKIVEHYTMTLSDKAIKELFSTLKTTLELQDSLEETTIAGLMGTKNYLVAKSDNVNHVVQHIRENLIDTNNPTYDDILLIALLEKANLIKQYFNKDERHTLKETLKTIRKSDAYRLITQMLNYLDSMICIITTAAIN